MLLTIDRFILKIWTNYFLMITGSILSLVFLIYFLESVLYYNKPLSFALINGLSGLVINAEIIIPFMVLVSTLLTFSKLYKDGEILSIKAAGITQLRILRGVFVATFVVCSFLYINQSVFIKVLNAEFQNLILDLTEKKNDSRWYYLDNQLIKVVNPSLILKQIQQIEVLEYDTANKFFKFSSFDDLSKVGDLWQAKSAKVIEQKNDFLNQQKFTDYKIFNLELDKIIQTPLNPDIYQTFSSLYKTWQASRHSNYLNRLTLLVILKKISFLLGIFLFIFLALIFSESNVRSNKNIYNFIASIFIYYVYIFTDKMFFIMAKNMLINVVWGSFGANIMLFIYIVWRLRAKSIV